ncbi:T9SS type B sorting domain-containing protein [Moheibacter lacus]|uniref:T9SS type B sorting domain-containing protein n=1 Tax=Moheibacter lacus TaxID=2745851 RepID=A0A838ZQ17_9FLAO|nr:T9SS type B sorting domain-containing protein [Moheibacter lacus]MBA5629737.1 T9SS type B sorting domain-containing protein [Moheibacter lacus]
MKKILIFVFNLIFLSEILGQITITDPKSYTVCDTDGDEMVTIPFSELQNFSLEFLNEFNESPEIYLTQAQEGIIRIRNLYAPDPQIQTVCGDTSGPGGYFDIAINSQKEIFVVRSGGVIQKIGTESQNCDFTVVGDLGQTSVALSFDHLDYLYEGGWSSMVRRAAPGNYDDFSIWHDFGEGNPSGDFVQIGDFMYVAWVMSDGKDYLFKVTLGIDNQYISHENLGEIDTGTFGLAAEYGRLYGNTIHYLYEIDLETMETNIIKQRPNQNNSSFNWWGAAGSHEALNLEISYHREEIQALNGTFPVSDPFVSDDFPTDWIYVRIHESTENKTYIIPIEISIQSAPTGIELTKQACIDFQTGNAIFDLAEFQTEINPDTNLDFSFFRNLEDLETGSNQLPLTYSIPSSQTIYAKLDNGTENCYGTVPIHLIVPDFSVEYDDSVAFCLGTTTILSIPDTFETYEWIGLQGEDLNQDLDTNEVTVSQPGNYAVIVSDVSGCSYELPFEAVLGGAPEITNVQINGNSITVQVAPAGNYEYSLDGVFWQSSATFHNIPVEDYEIYVRDWVGCYSEPYAFTYFLIPNFISPNGDGKNDVWKIRGIEQFPDAEFQIFDRYGKLFAIRKADANGMVWDGKYLGNPVPSGTYWYILKLDETKKQIGSITVKNN